MGGFSDTSYNSTPVNSLSPANNMNISNPNIIIGGNSFLPGSSSQGSMPYNQSINSVNLGNSMDLSKNVVMTSGYASPVLPGYNSMPSSMNLSSLPSSQNVSLNNYANALNSAVNNYNVALSNYVNSYNNAIASLSVTPNVASTTYSSIPNVVTSGNIGAFTTSNSFEAAAPPVNTISYSNTGANNNYSIPINNVNNTPAYQMPANDMQRAKAMYDSVTNFTNNNSFVKDAELYGMTVEKTGGYGINPMTGSPGAYSQVDIMPYDPVINATVSALNSGHKEVAITGDGVLTANPMQGNSKSVVIDSNNPTFIGPNNLYSVYRSTEDLARDLSNHDAQVANNIQANIPSAAYTPAINNTIPVGGYSPQNNAVPDPFVNNPNLNSGLIKQDIEIK